MEDYKIKYEEWLNNPSFDEETRNELLSIKDDEKEIEDRFYKELSFGTAGLRGVIGAGLNRMNKYTVGRATQGLANYILKVGGQEKGVVISYDSRHMSKEFSELTALILNANGIRTYIFEALRPVPELSFAVRYLGCVAGVMITASHNPPEYNGYKVYWDDGSQIVPPVDGEIIDEVNSTKFESIKTIAKNEAIEKGLYNTILEEVDEAFSNKLKSLVINKDAIETCEDLKIVYTPLHGTGGQVTPKLLREIGFKNVYVVAEQEKPNGDFPTVDYPNPEDPNAFKMALDLAKEVDADVVVANDPDADRVGLYCKNNEGEYISFTGNMFAILVMEYLLSQRKANGLLKENPCVISTVVSTNMTQPIAEEYGAKDFYVLTGFKWVGALMKKFEQENSYNMEFAFEESFGCIISDHARDKDGISAVTAICEAAAYYKNNGETLYQHMIKLYEKYGWYKEKQISIVLKGADGAEKIKTMMENLRNKKVEKIANWEVNEVRDYQTHKIVKRDGSESETDLPTSNVLYYDLSDNSWFAVRPSGTEPKIKLYIGVKGSSEQEANEQLAELSSEVEKLVRE
jgi:phosphoglucomutase